MTLIANSNTKYVIRVDFNDDQVGMEIEKYVFDNN